MRLLEKLVLGAAALALSVLPMQAAEYKMILAHSLSDPQNPIYRTFEKIKTDLEARSNGRIAVEIMPGGALGGDREAMESMMLGDIQFSPQSTSAAVQFVPELAVFDMPYTLPADPAKLKRSSTRAPSSTRSRPSSPRRTSFSAASSTAASAS